MASIVGFCWSLGAVGLAWLLVRQGCWSHGAVGLTGVLVLHGCWSHEVFGLTGCWSHVAVGLSGLRWSVGAGSGLLGLFPTPARASTTK